MVLVVQHSFSCATFDHSRYRCMNDFLPGLSQSLNVHPVFVHFPIALWSFALLLWTMGQFLHREDFQSAGRWALYAGSIAGVLAVATGYLAAGGLGHDSPGHDFVHTHRSFMLFATGLAVLTSGLAFILRGFTSPRAKWVVTSALLLTVSMTTLGADRGAMLVYTYGMGTHTAPQSTGSPHSHDDAENQAHEAHKGPHTSSDSQPTPDVGEHH